MFRTFNVTKNETQQVKGLDTWVVAWQRRYGEFSGDVEMRYQAFADKKEAEKLKVALDNAFRLIGTTCGSKVTIKKQDVGL